MSRYLTSITALIGFLLLAGAAPGAQAAPDDDKLIRGDDPVVIELFSSQGCGYCPQADDFLAKLTKFDNIIALACHVDYFDTPFWGDPLSQPFCTARQNDYVNTIQKGPTYTPQMIVNGDLEVVGYHFDEVLQTIRFADSRRMAKVDLAWTDQGRMEISLPESNMSTGDTIIWLARLKEPKHLTVTGGANRGKKIYYVNVIERMGDLGSWDGTKKTVTIEPHPGEETYAYAVLLQNGDGIGRIVGAAIIELPAKTGDKDGQAG